MTAATAAPGRRPVAWTRLAWVAWRQHRAALAGTAVVLGGLSVYMLIMGLRIRGVYSTVAACHPARSAACQLLGTQLDSYHGWAQTLTGALQVIPVLIGAFTGGPLLARELETGTFRFAWTQGCGRLRWAVTKLVLLAAAVTGAGLAFSLLFAWYYHPFIALGYDGVMAPQIFDLRGIDFAAWTLAAFAIGAFAGMVIRRTVPAMAASLAAWAGLDLATALFFRKHYQPPLIANGLTNPGLGSSWVVNRWWTGNGGHLLSRGAFQNALGQMKAAVGKNGTDADAVRWLQQRHYMVWWSYQPQSRFWHFQFIEGGWLLALSVLLIALTIWLVRRRAA